MTDTSHPSYGNETGLVHSKKFLSETRYNQLKKFTTVVLPAFATLYFSMATTWNLPNPEGVVATCAAITTFLGVTLNISSNRYFKSDQPYDGVVRALPGDEGQTVYSLEMDTDLDTIGERKNLNFKVN